VEGGVLHRELAADAGNGRAMSLPVLVNPLAPNCRRVVARVEDVVDLCEQRHALGQIVLAMIELGLLTVMIVALVGCLRLLAANRAKAVARRA
jgi:hypothetical protein